MVFRKLPSTLLELADHAKNLLTYCEERQISPKELFLLETDVDLDIGSKGAKIMQELLIRQKERNLSTVISPGKIRISATLAKKIGTPKIGGPGNKLTLVKLLDDLIRYSEKIKKFEEQASLTLLEQNVYLSAKLLAIHRAELFKYVLITDSAEVHKIKLKPDEIRRIRQEIKLIPTDETLAVVINTVHLEVEKLVSKRTDIQNEVGALLDFYKALSYRDRETVQNAVERGTRKSSEATLRKAEERARKIYSERLRERFTKPAWRSAIQRVLKPKGESRLRVIKDLVEDLEKEFGKVRDAEARSDTQFGYALEFIRNWEPK